MDQQFVRKAITPEDQEGFRRCCSIAFLSSFNKEEFQAKTPEELAKMPTETWVSGENGNVTSGIVFHDFDVWFDGKKTKATGVGGVSSVPEGRSQGGIRAIFEKELPDAYERGFVFSILFPFSHIFYRKFGYELTQATKIYKFDIEDLKPFVDNTPAKLISDAAEIKEIHDTFGRAHTLTISRREDQWHLVSKDPVKDVNFTYLIGDSAFVTFRPTPEDKASNVVNIRDLGYKDIASFKSLLGFLYSLRAVFSKVRIALPDDVPMMELLAECYDGAYEGHAHGMSRIVNVQKALELMNYEGSGHFTVKVSDEQIAQNNGVFEVTYTAGQPAVKKVGDNGETDLTVTIQRLCQLVTGTLTVEEALWLDGVSCTCPEKFKHVFVHKPQFYNDPF